jgi:hypothetical protein
MLLRYKLADGKDWCVRTHLSTPIGEDKLVGTLYWARCGTFPRSMTDQEIHELLPIPDDLNDITLIHIGDPEAEKPKRAERGTLTEEDKRERRARYNHERYLRLKGE